MIWLLVLWAIAAGIIILTGITNDGDVGFVDWLKAIGLFIAAIFFAFLAMAKNGANATRKKQTVSSNAKVEQEASFGNRKSSPKQTLPTTDTIITAKQKKDFYERFKSNNDPSLAYELGRHDLARSFMGHVGYPPLGLACLMPYAVAVHRNDGIPSKNLDWPAYLTLTQLEKEAVSLMHTALFGDNTFLNEMLERGVSMSFWEPCFLLQESSAKHWGLAGHPKETLFNQIYCAGKKLPKVKQVYRTNRLEALSNGFEPHVHAYRIVNEMMKRGKPLPSSIEAAKEEQNQLSNMAKPIHLERSWNDGSERWLDKPSWFGGVPRIGAEPWPRSKVSGSPMQFVAQIDLAELRSKTGAATLPSSGSLAFFLSIEDDSWEGDAGRVLHVNDTRLSSPSPVPTDMSPPYNIHYNDLHFADDEVKSVLDHYPEWPVELIAFDQLNIDAEADQSAEQIANSGKADSILSTDMIPLLEERSFEAPYPYSDIYWHTVLYLYKILTGEKCANEVTRLYEGNNVEIKDDPESSRKIAKAFEDFVKSIEARLIDKQQWAIMSESDVNWLQEQCKNLFTEFKIPMRNHYGLKKYEDVLQRSWQSPLIYTYWHTAKLALCAMKMPQVEKSLSDARSGTLIGLDKDIEGKKLADDFVEFRESLLQWADDNQPWAIMAEEDVIKLRNVLRSLRSEFREIVRYVFCLSDVESLEKLTLNAIACNPISPIKELAPQAQLAINLIFRQSIRRNHQMFGDGIQVQGNAADHYRNSLMLLQLNYDMSMGWQFGDVGVFQFWITPEDFEANRWDKVEVSFEGH